jgi:hypothetical protein
MKLALVMTCIIAIAFQAVAWDRGIGAAEAAPIELVPDPLPEQQRAAREAVEASRPGAGSKAIWLLDDFEDGILDGWYFLGGSCTATVTTATAAQGTHSMFLSGDCGNLYQSGLFYNLGSFQATGIGVWIRSGDNSEIDAVFAVGGDDIFSGGEPILELSASNSGYWVLKGPDIYWAIAPYNPNEWYDIGFTIDWMARTYDTYINNVLEMDDAPFLSDTATTLKRLYISNSLSYPFTGTETWWDQIVLTTPPPMPPIFVDGFESGNTSAWSATTP